MPDYTVNATEDGGYSNVHPHADRCDREACPACEGRWQNPPCRYCEAKKTVPAWRADIIKRQLKAKITRVG